MEKIQCVVRFLALVVSGQKLEENQETFTKGKYATVLLL